MDRVVAAAFVILTSGALDRICLNVESELEHKHLEGQEVVDYTMDYLSRGDLLTMPGRNQLKKALENVMNGEECSQSSLDYVATIGQCRWGVSLRPLTSAASRYAIKCLTSDYLSKVLLDETEASSNIGRLFKGKKLSDLIDDEFFTDFQAANPDNRKMELFDIKPYSEQLVTPFARLLERYAENRGKDLGREFSQENAVASYIKRNIVAPCKTYMSAAKKVLDKIDEGENLFHDGGKRKLKQLLDRKAQMVVFRHNVCHIVPFALGESGFAAKVLERL